MFVATKAGVRYQTVVVEAVDDAAATVRAALPAWHAGCGRRRGRASRACWREVSDARRSD
ncbi:hypothetical protein ACU4GD_23130 [Cupriavidus basilensis]